MVAVFRQACGGACLEHRPRPIYMAGGTPSRPIVHAWVVIAMALVLAGCTSASAVRPAPTPTRSESPSPEPSPSASESTTPTPTPAGVDPGFVPALAAIQMVGPRLGWAVGSHAIFATTDGTRWTKQYASTEEFVGVDFISATTGWAVATRTLLGTSDGGRTWRQLGEPRAPIRSIHFASATQGWGIAGGSDPQQIHGWLVPHDGATVAGSTWKAVRKESMSEGGLLPGVRAGPDTYPPSFSVVDPQDAIFVGDGPAPNVAQCVVASNGGATLRRPGHIDNAPETFAA